MSRVLHTAIALHVVDTLLSVGCWACRLWAAHSGRTVGCCQSWCVRGGLERRACFECDGWNVRGLVLAEVLLFHPEVLHSMQTCPSDVQCCALTPAGQLRSGLESPPVHDPVARSTAAAAAATACRPPPTTRRPCHPPPLAPAARRPEGLPRVFQPRRARRDSSTAAPCTFAGSGRPTRCSGAVAGDAART